MFLNFENLQSIKMTSRFRFYTNNEHYKQPNIVAIKVESVEKVTKEVLLLKNQQKRSHSLDNNRKKKSRKFKEDKYSSCLNLSTHFEGLTIKPANANSFNENPKNLLKLPNSCAANSKLSINYLLTPTGSFYDVSDTNSIIFNNNFEDEFEDFKSGETKEEVKGADKKLSKLQLSQLDEQIATNFKLKCKNWLHNFINSSN